MHSLAYRALGAPLIADKVVDQFNSAHPAYAVTPEKRTPEQDAPMDYPAGSAPGDAARAEVGLLRARMAPRELWPPHASAWSTAWESFKADAGAIDFTDMIEMALSTMDTAPGDPDVIFADEVQDYSRLELALLRQWGRSSRNLVLAGDPDQAIYEWRGADPAVFLDHDVGANRRILAQSYRVPRAVHAVAAAWVSRIKARIDAEYRPREAEGKVRREPSMRWKYPEAMLRDIERWAAAGESVIIQATCDYMLAPTLAVLRREGIPFSNPWRAERGQWNPLAGRGVTMARRILAYLRPDLAGQWWSAEDIRVWTEVLKAEGILRRGAKTEIDALGTDSTAEVPMERLAGWFEDDALAKATDVDLAWWRRSLLAKRAAAADYPLAVYKRRGAPGLTDTPLIHVGTIHSFKGAEADHVVLYPDISPQGMRQWQGPQSGRDAVIRQFYVGMTRARESLTLCAPSSPYAVAWG